MSNDGTGWHSDDELASALERAFEASTPVTDVQAGSHEGAPTTAANDFSDLFAALSEPAPAHIPVPVEIPAPVAVFESAPVYAPVAASASEDAGEQVFESLDDFIPQVAAIHEAAQSATVVESVSESAPTVPVTSAHITQPIRWDRQRPTFDEIIFGTAAPEAN